MIKVLAGAMAMAAVLTTGAAAQSGPSANSPEAAIVLRHLELILSGNVAEAYELVAEDFIQHNPTLAGDKAGTEAALTQMVATVSVSYDVKRVISGGGYVVVHAHLSFGDGGPGTAVVDIYRVADGFIAEHWDVLQPVPDTPANTNTMF